MKKFFKKHLFVMVVVIIFASLSGIYAGIVEVSLAKFNGFTIVVDAGHGGLDVK